MTITEAPAAPPSSPAAPTPTVVGLRLAAPAPQRRRTVAFRLLLALPHLAYLTVLWVVASFAVVAGWCAALVTGRVPGGIATFVGRVVQYSARVTGYAQLLLTDRYPPFRLDADDHAISVELPPPGRLNRAAVLFRGVLQVPALVVLQVLAFGLNVATVFVWLVVLVSGRLPDSVFQAFATILRYQVRAYAYVGLLTGEYPGGLFGDQPPRLVAAPLDLHGGAPSPVGPTDLPITGGPAAPPATLRITRFVLSPAAKRVVAIVLVVGALVGVGTTTASGIAAIQADAAGAELDEEHEALADAAQAFGTEAQSCALSGGAECLHAATRDFASAFEAFGTGLRAIDFPSHAVDLAHDVDVDTAELVALLGTMAATDDPDAHAALAQRYDELAERFDAHVFDLRFALGY